MNSQTLRTWFIGVPVAIALSLSGCSSGGDGEQMMPGSGEATVLPVPMVPANHGIASGSEITVQPGASEEHGNVVVSCPTGGEACDLTVAADGTINYHKAGGEPSVLYVLQPNGLIASTQMPEVFANSDADTLRNLLPTGTTEFAPLTVAIKRNFTDSEVTKLDAGEAYLKAIAGDGSGGFRLTLVIEGQEIPVHLEADDYSESDFSFRKDLPDGSQVWLWSYTDAFNQVPRNQGTSYRDHSDQIGWLFGSYGGQESYDYLSMSTFGARTNPENVPMGHAAYVGGLRADFWNANDASSRTSRARLSGRMVLEADFGDSEISGTVHTLSMRAPGASRYESLAEGNSIDISDGRVAEGRFTAQWTGRDTNAGSAAEDSVRGFEGTVLGGFYGPAAEEVGGVLNGGRPATATTPEQHVHGLIWGDQHNPTVLEGDLSLLSVAMEYDRVALTTQPAGAVSRVTAIEGDGAGGFYVTYQVDGVDSRVHLDVLGIGSHPWFRRSYHERLADQAYFFWDHSRSFSDDPEFSYFNVNGWAVWDYAADGSVPAVRYGAVISGVPTEAADLPSGTADYAGRMFAESEPSANRMSGDTTTIRGNLVLTADFGASTVGGMIDGIEVQAPGQSVYQATDGQWMIGNGSIVGNQLTADLTGQQSQAGFTGDMTGQFFGPAAAEVGGVLEGTNTGDNAVVHGYFGGIQQ